MTITYADDNGNEFEVYRHGLESKNKPTDMIVFEHESGRITQFRADDLKKLLTGRMAVITEEGAKRVLNKEMFTILQWKRFAFVPDSIWEKLGL